jgi:ribonuclease J
MPDTAAIIIHRGTHQIGGCVTEVSCGQDRVFIDLGADLPGGSNSGAPEPIYGLTAGDGSRSALFLTHYHADHIGRLDEALPDIPIYMGKTAKAILVNLARQVRSEILPVYGRIKTFTALETKRLGKISVTPLMTDHSAFDSYMFVIEAGGKRILHTGDFRTHGFRGGKTFKMLRCYARDIDYIVCEGTMLSRVSEKNMTERDLQNIARKMMGKTPYVFVLCSSTNIDRIGVFYHANPRGRLFVCDEYQKKQLDFVSGNHSHKSRFYDFGRVMSYSPNLNGSMEKRGFCMLIRRNDFFKQFLEKYNGRGTIIYSMWDGYLSGEAKNPGLIDFLAPFQYEKLHTSGHAAPGVLAELYSVLKPKEGLIPIHSDSPERFEKIITRGNIILLSDKETLIL